MRKKEESSPGGGGGGVDSLGWRFVLAAMGTKLKK